MKIAKGKEGKKELTGIELVHAAHPLEAGGGEVVEGHQVVIAGQAVDGADSDLVQPREEILGHIDRLLEVLGADVGGSHGVGCRG